MTAIGIDKIGFYIPQYYVALDLLAARDNIDTQKFHQGIGQECFAMPPHDEDVVTLAANAAEPLLNDEDKAAIDTVMLATESAIDQSKSAAVYVHRLLELAPNCRAIELKQACYSATAGLLMARDYVAQHPHKKVLLIASDLSRYDMHSAAEATQGAAAVAMLIAANARIATLHAKSGCYMEDVMDFWRPNHCHTPLVDGKLSTLIYLRAAQRAYQDYQHQGGLPFEQFAQYCYHLPFAKMAVKAHQKLCRSYRLTPDYSRIDAGMHYSRQIGNSYTAALYLSLCSALDHRDDLAQKDIAMYSYGSGCVAEFFHLCIADSYLKQRRKAHHARQLRKRQRLSYEDYEAFWQRPDLNATETLTLPRYSQGNFRFSGIHHHQRCYTRQSLS